MDKEFYNGVFNFTFDYEKFYREKNQLENIDYDTCDSIQYYDFNLIQLAIHKVMNQEIDYRYFAHWCNAYNWMITRNYHLKRGIKYFIYQEISWFLDGLSFRDKKVSFKEGKKWIEDFKLLDDIFRTNDWKVFYAPALFSDYNDQNVLFYNDKKKIFTIMYMEWIRNGFNNQNVVFISEEELVEKINYYKKCYHFYEYEKVKYLDDNIRKALKKIKKKIYQGHRNV